MDNLDLRRLLIAGAGGLSGFFLLIIANMVYVLLALWMGGFGFGGGHLSPSETRFVSVVVSTIIVLGAGIPAWTLHVTWWHGLLAGFVAMIVFTRVSYRGPNVNYAPFIEYETIAYLSAIAASMITASIGKSTFHLTRMIVLIILAVALIRLKSVLLPTPIWDEQVVGFLMSMFAWILLPLTATFFLQIEHGNANTEELA